MSTNRAFGNFGKFKEISLKMYVQVLFYFFPGNFLEIVCPGMYPRNIGGRKKISLIKKACFMLNFLNLKNFPLNLFFVVASSLSILCNLHSGMLWFESGNIYSAHSRGLRPSILRPKLRLWWCGIYLVCLDIQFVFRFV